MRHRYNFSFDVRNALIPTANSQGSIKADPRTARKNTIWFTSNFSASPRTTT